jgi:tRNA/tmRNA/rRNA uracil-C5-methylase (TrmA/RlmC/RlmD family)
LAKKESSVTHQHIPARPVIADIQSRIEAMEKNLSLYQEESFDERIEAIDFIEFHIIDWLDELLLKTAHADELMLLKSRTEKVKTALEEIDLKLFKKLRSGIKSGAYTGRRFKSLINEYVDFSADDSKYQQETGYDNLDVFVNGLSPLQTMPKQTRNLEPEMVYYQKTPARIIFELVENVHFGNDDVFFDLGSGLGQVAILINLLTGVTVKGVEFEPAFCSHARVCAAELNLTNVTFINADARKADYSDGTLFFMFTPFRGGIMQEVLEILRRESLSRKIKIITYGPCTAQVALQNWLHFATPKNDSTYKLAVFSSF